MAGWHRDPYTVYINRSSLRNFGLGFDRYQELDDYGYIVLADSLALNFIFFNITITRWREDAVWKTSKRS
jgi:hypothetical protein